MFRQGAVFVLTVVLLFNIYGCVALVAGAAAGAGTAVWLSGKLTQQFSASYENTIEATEKALAYLKLEVKKVTREDTVTQFISDYSGKEVWIDIRKLTPTATKVEVRVGGVTADKDAATNILKNIEKNL